MPVEQPAEQLWDQMWLPLYPFAADDFVNGMYRMARGEALGKRLIQANPHAMANLLVVDCDHPDSALRALSAVGNHPMPNAIVENPLNGHSHILWWLLESVTKTERARLKPLIYATAVAEGLRRAVDGDKHYGGLMTKNPLHKAWTTHWLTPEPYSLGDLERQLGPHMPRPGWNKGRPRADTTGLARNCSLFEDSRWWAYRELRHWFGNPQGLSNAIHAGIHTRNQEFAEPLPHPEAAGIARSITTWITTKSHMWKDGPVVYGATYAVIQSHRGKKSGEKRRSAARDVHQAMLEAQGGN